MTTCITTRRAAQVAANIIVVCGASWFLHTERALSDPHAIANVILATIANVCGLLQKPPIKRSDKLDVPRPPKRKRQTRKNKRWKL